MSYESTTPFLLFFKKKKKTGVQEKRLLFSYDLSRLPKWLLFPVFNIRLSALVDNKTIFIHVQ